MSNTRNDSIDAAHLIWGDPPPSKHGGTGKYSAIAQALQERSGEWARLPITFDGYVAAGRVAHHISQGQYAGFTKGHYKTSVRTANGVSHVYAKHVGPAGIKPQAVPDAVA